MDRVDAVVAIELLDREVMGVTGAAMHLDRQIIGLQTPFRGPGFADGSKQVEKQIRPASGLLVACRLIVQQLCQVEAQSKPALNIGLLLKQPIAAVRLQDARRNEERRGGER